MYPPLFGWGRSCTHLHRPPTRGPYPHMVCLGGVRCIRRSLSLSLCVCELTKALQGARNLVANVTGWSNQKRMLFVYRPGS